MSDQDKSSSNPAIQREYCPEKTAEVTQRVTPERVGEYSPGAPKDSSATATEPIRPAKIYRD